MRGAETDSGCEGEVDDDDDDNDVWQPAAGIYNVANATTLFSAVTSAGIE